MSDQTTIDTPADVSDSTIRVERPWDLSQYDQGDWAPGRSFPVRALWYFISQLIFENGWFPFSGLKTALLGMFGAKVGKGVVFKPNVRIKFPWRLQLGDHCWVGEGVWIDNLAEVSIGANCCLSQDVYICTGSHDHRREDFALKVAPVSVGESSWVCARAVLLPGAAIESQTVVKAGSVIR